MNIDIASQIQAITREVIQRERDGRPVKVVLASRTYDTTLEDLWDAITNAERIPRWFMPISGELRLGGRFALQGNASGEILRCDPPRHLATTWEFGGGVTWVDVRLFEDPAGGARLELEHAAPIDAMSEEMNAKYGPGAVGVGWELGLVGLHRYLSTGIAVDHAQAEAWSVSDEGKAFIHGSSEGWGRAAIAAGTPEDAAMAAAARTTAFYTGQAPPGSDG